MEKSPHTTRTCRSYRAGEKRGLALGLAAVGCQRVWGEKHGDSGRGFGLALDLWCCKVRPNQPIVIRAKPFAADGASRCALNSHALFNRNRAKAVAPLVDGRRLNAKALRQCAHRSDKLCRVQHRLELITHAQNYKALPKSLQGIASTIRQTGY
jgi:hypothetical protein